MLFSNTLQKETLPQALKPYTCLLFDGETDTKSYNDTLSALLVAARADIAAHRRAEEAGPTVSACVLAWVMLCAVRRGAPRHLLSDGLSVLLYHANHNARGGLFGCVGAEIASKIGYVPADQYENSAAHTVAVSETASAIATVASALGYDDDFVQNYERRAGSAASR